MCLRSVTSVEKEKLPRGECRVGWKSVTLKQNNGKWYFRSMFNSLKQCNTWLKCTSNKNLLLGSTLCPYRLYPTGFHIFETRAGARWWKGKGLSPLNEIVVKVEYRRVVARGLQGPHKCVVAKGMFVIKE